jgi:hypothetical protein
MRRWRVRDLRSTFGLGLLRGRLRRGRVRRGGRIGCDAPEVFQPAEDALDGVATAVERGAEAALAAPVCLRRDVSSGHLRFVLRTPSVLGTAAGASIAPQKRSASKARSAITRAPSGTASIGVSPPRRSAVLPPERWNAIGLPAWFAAAWILLVRPPRGGPHRGLPRWVPRPPDGLRVLPPFSARGASVRLRIGRIPQHLSGRATSGRKRLEEAPPDAFDCPAQEPVVQRLRRAVLARRMPPRATRAQHMDDTAEHTPVVHPRLAASLRRQERRKPPHLRLAQRDTDRSSRFPPTSKGTTPTHTAPRRSKNFMRADPGLRIYQSAFCEAAWCESKGDGGGAACPSHGRWPRRSCAISARTLRARTASRACAIVAWSAPSCSSTEPIREEVESLESSVSRCVNGRFVGQRDGMDGGAAASGGSAEEAAPTRPM